MFVLIERIIQDTSVQVYSSLKLATVKSKMSGKCVQGCQERTFVHDCIWYVPKVKPIG